MLLQLLAIYTCVEFEQFIKKKKKRTILKEWGTKVWAINQL